VSIDISSDSYSLNLSNGNFFWLMSDVLGYSDLDYCGTLSAPTLLERVRRAQKALQAQPSEFGRTTQRDGNIVHCGVTPEYVAMRLQELHRLALEAANTGKSVCYG
jgi:N-acetylglutamate synthase-like GNAT family acetyltransferase